MLWHTICGETWVSTWLTYGFFNSSLLPPIHTDNLASPPNEPWYSQCFWLLLGWVFKASPKRRGKKNGISNMHKVSSKVDIIWGTIKKKSIRQEKHHPCLPWSSSLSSGQNSEEWREEADRLINRCIVRIPIKTTLRFLEIHILPMLLHFPPHLPPHCPQLLIAAMTLAHGIFLELIAGWC